VRDEPLTSQRQKKRDQAPTLRKLAFARQEGERS
jgi:hypothetical protein